MRLIYALFQDSVLNERRCHRLFLTVIARLSSLGVLKLDDAFQVKQLTSATHIGFTFSRHTTSNPSENDLHSLRLLRSEKIGINNN